MKMYRSLAVLIAAAALSLQAFAHSMPKTMEPAAKSTVAAPKQLSVHFTEALDPKFSMLKLTDAAGTAIPAKTAVDKTDAMHLTLPLPMLKPGVYTVGWATAALDGHRATGKYTFTVK